MPQIRRLILVARLSVPCLAVLRHENEVANQVRLQRAPLDSQNIPARRNARSDGTLVATVLNHFLASLRKLG